VIYSGDGDRWYDRVLEFVEAAGPKFRAFSRLATHMEVKLARRSVVGACAIGTSRSPVIGCSAGSCLKVLN
jgi:hypothetical protein